MTNSIAPDAPPVRPSFARIGMEIRATHVYGFRSGEWALVEGFAQVVDRLCYVIRFPDGVTDAWPVTDPSDPYEFRTV